MKSIGVLTSGGDTPAMNTAIRAVVRMGLALGLEMYGVERGYEGLMEGAIAPMTRRDVGGIIGRGGTILQSARADDFRTEAGRKKAIEQMERRGIEGLVCIGGSGTHQGANLLSQMGVPVVTVPSTIDNDLCYTDITLGVDTALNTALEAIDRLRDTASAHRRAFLVETMGRDSGYLALMAGVAGGAEIILIPESPMKPGQVVQAIQEAHARGKMHTIIVVAEGYQPGTQALYNYLRMREDELGFSVRMSILGHLQRGGAPTAYDRILGTRYGTAAVQQMAAGNHGVMVGLIGNKIRATAISQVVKCKKELDLTFYDLAAFIENGKPAPNRPAFNANAGGGSVTVSSTDGPES